MSDLVKEMAMRLRLMMVAITLVSVGWASALVDAETKSGVKSGPIALKEFADVVDIEESGDAFRIEVGDQAPVECRLGIGDVLNRKAIFCLISGKGKVSARVSVAYHMAFFDKDDNLVACFSQGSGEPLEVGSDTMMLACFAHAPGDELAKIRSYKLVWYESTSAAKK